ncbi:MAG: ankyrin repeat domain-containing protein [Candidatus Endonucleobacter bathymodioli]|uniref:Ankyrin repeat domain-containing protein n=1 Tax=Candidatus Endonucleibacter bathymodioli TaxID=539814 RepID=A0AA90NQ00_9GAMM|nr:ankyrin repeat domain-containing protein [Candidatus Endonucleobacter bathymodioli]
MFLALYKSLARPYNLIYLLLFFIIITGLYSGGCCAAVTVNPNNHDDASFIDSVDESNNTLPDSDARDDSNTYKDGSFLDIVQTMYDCALLGAMKSLLDIAITNNDDNLIHILQINKAPHHLSTGNDAADLQYENSNHDYIVKFLRDNIVTLTNTYKSGECLLSVAIPSGNNKLIELLVESGVNINSLDTKLNTPLHQAVRCGHLDIVKILLAAGAKVVCVGSQIISNQSHMMHMIPILFVSRANLMTPFHTAPLRGKTNIGKVPIETGTQSVFYIKCQYSLLRMAVMANSHSILKVLLNAGAKMDANDIANCDLLHYAIYNLRSNNIIKELIINVAKEQINMESSYGTALSIAIIHGSDDTIKNLLNNGANPNHSDRFKDRPLHIALDVITSMKFNSTLTDLLELLIAEGANLNYRDAAGMTPLMLVVHHDFSEYHSPSTTELIIRMMLRNGADMDMIDNKGCTALHHAANNSNNNPLSLLLENGANRDIKNQAGLTAEECATPEISKKISEASFVTREPARLGIIVRSSIRNLIIKNSQEIKNGQEDSNRALSDMVKDLNLPKIIYNFITNHV